MTILLETLQARLPAFANHLGITFIEASKERVVAELTVREDLGNGQGAMHGGALMAFADTLGAFATFLGLPPGGKTTTLESKTNFIGPAFIGTVLRGVSTPLHRGRRTNVWETQITTAEGKLVCKVTQTQVIL